MKLYYKCSNCTEINTWSQRITNRAEFITHDKKGMILECQSCFNEEMIDLNNIRARVSVMSKIAYMVGLSIAILIGTIILLKYWDDDLGIGLSVIEVFGIGVSIPILISSVIVNEERKLVKLFNGYYV